MFGTWFGRIFNGLLVLLVVYMVWQRVEVWNAQKSYVGKQVGVEGLTSLEGNPLPSDALAKVRTLIFWATWCTPCAVELQRIQSAVNDGELDPELLLAIAIWDDLSAVKAVVQEKNYGFPVAFAGNGKYPRELGVKVTPTKIRVDSEAKIIGFSNGIEIGPVANIADH
jgi:thiol-disulfide isomerase/thioredoxin